MPDLADAPTRRLEGVELTGAAKKETKPEVHSVKSDASVHLGGILQNAAEIADAQFSIWKLQLSFAALRVVAGAVGGVLILALGIYGFVLLDHTADVALLRHPEGVWLSPLARGGFYFLIGLAVLGPIFKSAFSSSEDSAHA